ncbi:enoyl-CoA hydratase/isomerase family protein [bacterium]|nr:enoyl-CoA hydratase/isomerase family protein [bacterium]
MEDRAIRNVGVVGAGTMGSGIAQKLAQEGASVVLVDLDDAKVKAGLDRLRASLDEAVSRKIFDRAKADLALARVRGTASWDALADAELVIEAVFEDLAVKRDVFARLDRACRPDAILATNTSSFHVRDVANATRHPERVLGLHFFYHPAKNRLVEVVPHEKTDRGALARAWTFQERTGKTPIASKDAPGFVVNRFFVPWLNEAARVLDDGAATIPTVEAAAKAAFSIGMGPFELMNVTGIPIALHAAETLGRELGAFYAPSESLKRQVSSGKPWDLSGDVEPGKVAALGERLLGVVFQVAGEIEDEGIARAEDVDLGARVGLRWRAGPFELANELGTRAAAASARAVSKKHGRPLPRSLASREKTGEEWKLERVRLSREGELATITLARPDALNALDERSVAELAVRFREADAFEGVRGILIRGQGKAFVAGADVKWFVRQLDSKPRDEGISRIIDFTRRGQELLSSFARSKKVVVACVEGLSLGGGSELALACDYIVATARGSLGFPETGIGIYPGLGGTQRLSRRVGRGLARWLVFTGRTLSAEEAVSAGAFDELVSPENLIETARALVAKGKPSGRSPRAASSLPANLARAAAAFDVSADAILSGAAKSDDPSLAKDLERVRKQKAPVALRLADALVASSLETPLERGLEAELSNLREVFSTKDAYEGLSTLGRARPSCTGS